MEEKCIRCGRSEESIRLFDGVYGTEPVKICEKCSLTSSIPIIKRPTANQLKESEKPYAVRTRLMRLSGLAQEGKKEKPALEQIKDIENRPELEKPEDAKFKMVDNFHWIIQTSRRRKGLTAQQLGEAIAESAAAIKMLENKVIPRDSRQLLKKLEQFFNIKLIKEENFEKMLQKEKTVSRAHELPPIFVEEPEIEIISEDEESKAKLVMPEKPKALSPTNFKKDIHDKFSIGDLQRASKQIDDDMEFPRMSREQVGNEQTENFGKEDTEKLKRKVFDERKPRANVPSIYDLMKKKEEKEKTSVTGKDIQVVSDDDLE